MFGLLLTDFTVANNWKINGCKGQERIVPIPFIPIN